MSTLDGDLASKCPFLSENTTVKNGIMRQTEILNMQSNRLTELYINPDAG
jgi:hypothetical protein